MTKLTLSIISKILFGQNTLDLSEIDKISKYITIIIEYINRLRLPFLRFIELLPLPLTLNYKRALNELDNLIYDKINERRKIIGDNNTNKHNFDYPNIKELQNPYSMDMLSFLLKTSSEPHTENKEADLYQSNEIVKMTNRQLRDEIMTLFLAGHETTANALTWALYLLALHPKVESKIVDEIVSIIGSENIDNKIIAFEDVPKLKYTEMVLMESMRLYPPSWAIGRQAIDDYIINDKYLIPSGSVLILSQYLMHRNPKYFDQPNQFYPERWTSEFKASIPRFSYFPFGGGPRACIGEPLAWIEGVIILATIIKEWKIKLKENVNDIKLQPLVTLRPKHGIRVKLDRRINNL
jgi:cytochrome P450